MLSNLTLVCLILENQKLKAEIARLKLYTQLHNIFVKELEEIIADFDNTIKGTDSPYEDPADIYPS